VSDEKKKRSMYGLHWKRGIKHVEQAIEELKEVGSEVMLKALKGLRTDIEKEFEEAKEKMKEFFHAETRVEA